MINDKRIQRIDESLARKQPTLQIMLDNIHSSQNLSAIIRSCEGVGVLELFYATKENKDLRIHKTISQGAHRWLERTRIEDTKKTLFLKKKQKEGFHVVVTHLEEKSVSFRDIDYTKPILLVMGNEKDGVSSEVLALADEIIVIPMQGMVQSLNVSVAAAIILYEAQRQLEEAGRYNEPHLMAEERTSIKDRWLYRDVIARRSKGQIPVMGKSNMI